MRIGLIGCGRAGVTLFQLLRKNNKVIGVHDLKKNKERTAARLLKVRNNPPLRDMVGQCEAIFIATPDDEILKAYKAMRKFLNGRKYIFHLSGVLPAGIIPRTKNINRASVHPFATFPEITAPPPNKHFFISIEGDPLALRSARKIFRKENFTLKKIKKEDKATYHLVGVFSSNLLVGLASSIRRMAGRINWREEEFEQMILPMIEDTVDNLKAYGIPDSLSGPIARGDVRTIEKHLRALKNDNTLLNVYKALSLSIVEAMSDGKRKRALKRILR
jgi:predicted short-subunit dehydrogenase-like oxidoreductase (DUF2520 family)